MIEDPVRQLYIQARHEERIVANNNENPMEALMQRIRSNGQMGSQTDRMGERSEMKLRMSAHRQSAHRVDNPE